MIKKLNFVCYGCGNDRPCRVESNQETGRGDPIEDLKCILDETNKTSYNWEYYAPAKLPSFTLLSDVLDIDDHFLSMAKIQYATLKELGNFK